MEKYVTSGDVRCSVRTQGSVADGLIQTVIDPGPEWAWHMEGVEGISPPRHLLSGSISFPFSISASYAVCPTWQVIRDPLLTFVCTTLRNLCSIKSGTLCVSWTDDLVCVVIYGSDGCEWCGWDFGFSRHRFILHLNTVNVQNCGCTIRWRWSWSHLRNWRIISRITPFALESP
jgi:hypothetical protein